GGNPGYAKKVKREVSQLVANLETEEIGRRNKKDKTC
ncbi:bifunctional precorrin-2 dehydrogenase/sirohydrochlorin ferrochelatase, partial [Listeria monocytogenes]|nr:bifunctional precorrin-2 dehydrogenase/sirohydrochlorin ferrochelatase [Listeria monocytogenes]